MQYPTLSRSHGAPRRARRADADPGAAGPDPQHRPGRAAPRRARRTGRRRATLADLRARLNQAAVGERIADAAAGARPPARRRSPRADRPRSPRDRRACSSRRCPTTAATSASRSAAPPTWPASATTSTPPSGRCSRRSRSTSCCSSCSARPTTGDAVTVRIGHEGPYRELASTSVVATGYGPGDEALGHARHRRPHPHGLPRIDGRRARGRALRLPDPRRRTTSEPGPLRAPRRLPRRRRRRRSRRPTAGSPASCTRTSTPTRRRRSGSRRSRAPTRCSPTRRSGRRTTAAATRSAGAGRRSARARASRSPTSWTRSSAAAPPAAAQGRGPRPRVRRGQDALIRLDVELAEAAFGVTRELKVDTAVVCTTCHGDGAAPGTTPITCETCRGAGEVAARAALVPRRDPHPAPVRGLPRLRHDHPGPVPRVLRRRPGPLAPHPDRQDPGRRRQRHPRPAHRPGRGRPRRRPGRRPLRRDPRRRRTRSSPATATTCTARSRCR